jgi:hypothetical protein
MQTQGSNMGKNFSRVYLLSTFLFFFSSLVYGSIYSLQMELKGRIRAFSVYERPRIMDPVTWHGKSEIFLILSTKPDVHRL